MKTGIPKRALVLLLAVALLIIIPFCIWEEPLTDALNKAAVAAESSPEARRALAWALFALLAADVFIPTPSSLVSTMCGMLLGAVNGFFVSFMAMNISCAVGYVFGRFCSRAAERAIGAADMASLKLFNEKWGMWLLPAMRPVPVLAEASVIFAGICRRPACSSAVLLTAGNAAVSAIYAVIGAWGKSADSMLPAFAAAIAVSGLFAALRKITESTAAKRKNHG